VIQAEPDKKQDTIYKIIRAERTGDLTQVVEHLPSKHKVLSSNPSIDKKKKDSLGYRVGGSFPIS
jgi:hypothetical protein